MKLKFGREEELKSLIGLRPGWLVTILGATMSVDKKKKKELLYVLNITLEPLKSRGRA